MNSVVLLFRFWLAATASNSSQDYNPIYPLTKPLISGGFKSYKIGIIADLDKSSKIVQNRSEWSSYIKVGTLSMTMKNEKFKLEWDNTEKEFRTGYSYKGRGMELSELIVFNGKLLTFDDRTGIVFEIHDNEALPWVILRSPKSNRFKIEWATVKDEKLYIGSTGKPWVSKTGEIIHDYDLKVKVVNSQGHIRGQNWTEEYRKIQEAVNITFPGYLIHESVVWSPEQKRWYFLPRRCSYEAYNEVADETKGCNFLISADSKFKNLKAVTLGELNSKRGFSSFKFVPGSRDRIIIALKTEEIEDHTASYITIFDINGKILLDDHKIPTNHKYEGFEFI